MNQSIKDLRMVHSITGAKRELEDVIKKILEKSENGEEKTREEESVISEEILEDVWRIHHKYAQGISRWEDSMSLMKGINIFINMDVEARLLMPTKAKDELCHKFEFRGEDANLPAHWASTHTGESIVKFIPHDFEEITEFFETNKDLFSKNTQAFIEKVESERLFEPRPSALKNEFEYKTFLAWLDDELDYEKMKLTFRFYREKAERSSRLRSLLYFAKAMEERYCDFEDGSPSTHLFVGGIIALHKLALYKFEYKTTRDKEIEHVIEPLRKEGRILDTFFSYSTRGNTNDEMREFMSKIAVKDEHWERLKKIGFEKEGA